MVLANPSKAALKLKKKREAKKAARQQAAENGETQNNGGTSPFVPSILSEEITSDDPEKLKKIKKLKSVSRPIEEKTCFSCLRHFIFDLKKIEENNVF